MTLRAIKNSPGSSEELGLLGLGARTEGTAWKTKPSWYIVAKDDRTVHPDLERFVAKRMGATTVEAASSHVPMLSQPSLVLDVIRKAASAVQKS